MSDSVKVRVCIPAYNCEGTIDRAINSILEQTVPCKVIVVDDCSTDATSARLSVYEPHPDVDVVYLDENRGPAHARNVAMDASSEPWLALLDSDDFMEPSRIELLLQKVESGSWDFVADNLYRVKESDIQGEKRQLWSADRFPDDYMLGLEEFVTANLSTTQGEQRVELGFIKPLMRRQFLEKNHLRYVESMRLGEDYDLYARALACRAKCCVIDAMGYVAVERSSSLSGQHRTEDLKALLDSDTRLLGFPHLSLDEQTAIKNHRLDTHKRWAWRRFLDTKKQRDFIGLAKVFNAPLPVVFYVVREAFVATFQKLREV